MPIISNPQKSKITNDRIEILKKRELKLKETRYELIKKRRRLEAEASQQQRKKDTRRKIIAGSTVLKMLAEQQQISSANFLNALKSSLRHPTDQFLFEDLYGEN